METADSVSSSVSQGDPSISTHTLNLVRTGGTREAKYLGRLGRERVELLGEQILRMCCYLPSGGVPSILGTADPGKVASFPTGLAHRVSEMARTSLMGVSAAGTAGLGKGLSAAWLPPASPQGLVSLQDFFSF